MTDSNENVKVWIIFLNIILLLLALKSVENSSSSSQDIIEITLYNEYNWN